MADSKITDLTSGDPAQATDEIPINRGGADRKITVSSLGREKLSANRTYYVRTNGSDSNTGLANTAGGAFLTVQHAVDVVAGTLDLNDHDVTIQVTGNFTEDVILKEYIGSTVTLNDSGGLLGPVIVGDAATPSNCIHTITHTGFSHTGAKPWYVKGFKWVDGSAGVNFAVALSGAENEYLYYSHCEFTEHAAGYHLNGRFIIPLSDYTISGDALAHYGVTGGTYWANYADPINNAWTITLTGTPNWTFGFIVISCDNFSTFGLTHTGASTGPRVNCQGGSINTFQNGSTDYFPGDVDPDTGGLVGLGQYNLMWFQSHVYDGAAFYTEPGGFTFAEPILEFQRAAGAINYVRLTNAATGNGPYISAIGGDANVDLNFAVSIDSAPTLAFAVGASGYSGFFYDAVTAGPTAFWQRTTTPLDDGAINNIGTFNFYGDNASGTQPGGLEYGCFEVDAPDTTAGSEDGKISLFVAKAGSPHTLIAAFSGSAITALDGFADLVKFDFGSTNFPSLLLTTTAGGGAGGPYIQNYLNSSSPAVADDLGGWYLYGNNNSAAAKLFAYMEGRPTSVTAAGEGGKWVFGVIEAGAHQEPLTIGGGQIALGATVHVEMPEISDPAAPGSNTARFYARDNGGGKTQLVVRFPTGAVQVIATEP